MREETTDLNSEMPQRGSIFFWKFKTDGWLGSEWHFSADSQGRAWFLEKLRRLSSSEEPSCMDFEISAVGRDTLDRCDFDGAYEDRARLKLTYWPSPAQADKWIISDNERIVDISFGRTILESWQRLLADESGNDRTLGLGEDHVVFVWR